MIYIRKKEDNPYILFLFHILSRPSYLTRCRGSKLALLHRVKERNTPSLSAQASFAPFSLKVAWSGPLFLHCSMVIIPTYIYIYKCKHLNQFVWYQTRGVVTNYREGGGLQNRRRGTSGAQKVLDLRFSHFVTLHLPLG